MSRTNAWTFTYFIEDEKSNDDWSVFLACDDKLRFAVWQLECCPSTGRKHLQGYLELFRSCRMAAVKKLLGSDSVHIEARKGSREQAIEYCRKEESRVSGPWTTGREVLHAGRSEDLAGVADRLREGVSLCELVEQHSVTYIRHHRGINALRSVLSKRRAFEFRELSVVVYYGEAGSGKTRRAIEESPEGFFILDQGERVWFDGYDGEGTLIIDDYYGWIKYGQLLRILDGHPYRAEIKGGFIYAQWTRVFITSNKHPSEWYATGMTPALERRINLIEEINKE